MATSTDSQVRVEATGLVKQWYEDFLGLSDYEPKYAEVKQAVELLKREGLVDVVAAYPVMIDLMRERFPTAVTWGGCHIYWRMALVTVRAIRKRDEAARRDTAERGKPDPVRAAEAALVNEWGPVWDRLPVAQREAIEEAVSAANPGARSMKTFFRILCVKEYYGRMTT